MYTAFFGLRCLPFEDRADAQFFFPAAEHEETLAAMEYEAHYGTGIGLVLGEAGTGKTLLIRTLLSRLHATDHVAVLTIPANGAAEILRECCKGFGVSLPSSPNDARRLHRLRRHLCRTIAAGHRTILVVDQAEHLTPANMGEIEALAELQTEQGRLLRVILAGHPRLRLLLNQPDFVRVRQQAFKEHVLSPLTEPETKDYIRHRLQVAGAGEADLFDPGALALIHASSGGVPRLINQVCNASMLAAYGADESRVSASIVGEVTGMASLPTSKRVRQERHPAIVAAQDGTDRPEYPAAAGMSREAAGIAPSDDRMAPSEPVFPRPTPLYESTMQAMESRVDWDHASDGSATTRADMAAAESRLQSLIERAERAGEVLARSIPQAADSAARAHRRIERFVGEADERMRAMESRLTEAASRCDESSAKSQRVDRACKRAEDVESRITEFAEQLADRVDDVQVRVGQLLGHVGPIEEARGRVEETIGRANALCAEAKRTLEGFLSRWQQEREVAERSMREMVSSEFEPCRLRIQEQIEGLERTARGVVENAEAGVRAAYSKLERDAKQTTGASEQLARGALDELRATTERMTAEFEQRASAIVQTALTDLAKSTREACGQAAACGEAGLQLATTVAAANGAREELENTRTSATETREKLQRSAVAANEGAKSVAEAAEASAQLLEQLSAATTEAGRIHDKTLKAVSAAERTIGGANEAIERLSALHIDTNMLAARLDSDRATARQMGDALTGLVAAADQKIGQLSSSHAAASQVHERLAKAVVSGHELAERADASVRRVEECIEEADRKAKQSADGMTLKVRECADEAVRRAEERMGESDARTRQLADNVGSLIRECTVQIERLEGGQSAVVDATKRLGEVCDAGARISMELALLVEQSALSASTLNERIERSGEIRERMDGFVARLDAAGELDAGLRDTVAGGRGLRDELSSLIEQSGRQQDSLNEANNSLQEMIRANERAEQRAKEIVEQVEARVASLSEADAALYALAEAHKQVEHSAHEAVERMDSYLTLLKETMETGEPLLNEFRSRIGALDVRLVSLGDRSAEIERKIGEGTVSAKAVVANAQSQAEHLDRVCSAVRKVFAGLSQASLEANDQTEGLRRAGAEAKRQLLHLTTESERAAKTLHEWLEEALRVQSRLEQVLDQSPSVSQTHPIEPLRTSVRKFGSVERSATINVEDEPGAAKARDIDAGLERMAIRDPAARADEIARLIAEAKAAKAEAVALA